MKEHHEIIFKILLLAVLVWIALEIRDVHVAMKAIWQPGLLW
jgi:hypothetical protein